MRRHGIVLLGLASLLLAVRLFTGIYYRSDEASAFFVLKPAPDWAIERDHTDGRRFDRATVLDIDELDLAYGNLYRKSMVAVPFVATVLAVVGLVLARRRRG